MKKNSILRICLLGLCALVLLTGNSQAGGRRDRTDSKHLPGSYHASYPVLFGETGAVLEVEKFLTIEATEAKHLFLYSHCWRLIEGGEWNHEKGALVVKSPPRDQVEFNIAELGDAPEEGSTGFFEGRLMDRNRLDMIYNGLQRAIVLRMEAKRTDVPLGPDSCPLE